MTSTPARSVLITLLLGGLALPGRPAAAQPASAALPPQTASAPSAALAYVPLVDLSLAAPAIVRATITRTRRIGGEAAAGLAPGQTRLLVEAQVEAALIAPDTIPQKLSWLQDVPNEARDSLKGQRLLAWLSTPNARGQAALIAGNAAQPWSAPLEARVRAVATEIQTGNVPIVTGVSNGFRVPGTVAGEAESQFFLETADDRPLTLIVLDRPGQSRSISVASSDIIDESATSVKPETLLWYRLACALPARLPDDAGGRDTALANTWTSIIASLGPCIRP